MTEVGAMPKEMIDSCSGSDISLRVGWQRESYVQVASVKADPFAVKWLDADGKPIPVDPTDPNSEGMVCDGMYADLDREGINRLIRALRKARDQVYGRDE